MVSHIDFLPRDLKALCTAWEVAKSTESLRGTVSLISKFKVSVDVLGDAHFMGLLERFPLITQGTISVLLVIHKT